MVKTSQRRRLLALIAVALPIISGIFLFLEDTVPSNASSESLRQTRKSGQKGDMIEVRSGLRDPRSVEFHSPFGNLLLASAAEPPISIVARDELRPFLSGEFPAVRSLISIRAETVFQTGDVFVGFENGELRRISADGTRSDKLILPTEDSPIVGLTARGDAVYAANGSGRIWRIAPDNRAEAAFTLPTEPGGIIAIPDNSSLYGDLAGKLLVGAPELAGIFVIEPQGAAAFYPLEFRSVDLDLVHEGENLFATDQRNGRIYQISNSSFHGKSGEILLTDRKSGKLVVIRWNGSGFDAEGIMSGAEVDQVTFAPIDLTDSGNGTCATSISQIENVFQWEAGTGTFAVSAASDCSWSAGSNAPWLILTGGQSGTGNGIVNYRVVKNETLNLREAAISIGTLTHTVRQSRKAQLQCRLQFTPPLTEIGAGGGTGSIGVAGSGECAWDAIARAPWLAVTGNPYGRGNGSISFAVGINLAAEERVGYIEFPNGSFAVRQGPNLAPVVIAGDDQSVTLPNTLNLSGTANDDGVGNPITVSWSKISGPESTLFSAASNLQTAAIFSQPGTYVLRLSATDGHLTASDDVTITVNADPTPPPPDPAQTAPILDTTVPTNIGKATEFLYTGINPIQTGVNPAAIKTERIGLIRGRVVGRSGNPITNVKVSVLGHSELGQTRTRADGMFDLVVNGGGDLTIQYQKPGFISVQREEEVDWQEYTKLDDVVMLTFDGAVSFIDLTSDDPIQVAESGVSSDASGSRRSRLLFKQGTLATMTLPDNTIRNLNELHVRATEFTVGPDGPEAMPGDLPPASAYTYAAEYSVDEAVAVSATDVSFSQPVVQYNENFLNFPVGISVPSGSYDTTTGTWIPSVNGRVVKILSTSGGTAELDVDGSGNPASDAAYAALGVSLAERAKLAELYASNTVLWRVPVSHFTPWDSNWGFGPPDDAEPPSAPEPECDTCEDDECEGAGCVIGFKNQTLSEESKIAGTPFFLRYDSARQKGRVSNRSLIIPVSGATVPASLREIRLTIEILGRTFQQTFGPATNQNFAFTWDGMDAFGRAVQGNQPADILISYVYDGVYQEAFNFASPGTGTQIVGSLTRREIEFIQRRRVLVSNVDWSRTGGIGGWSLNVHHVYDPNGRVLYEGNGARRSVQAINDVVSGAAGTGNSGFGGDGGPAINAELSGPSGVAVGPDGSYFIADSLNQRIRRVSAAGIITTIAGDGSTCAPMSACGDGGPALLAQLAAPTDLAVASDGSLYFSDSDSNRIRKIAPDGTIDTVAGTGAECVPTDICGDDGNALNATLNKPQYIDLTSDGTLFVADGMSRRVRRIATDGVISTIAGSGNQNCPSDNVPARSACLGETRGVAQDSAGNIYISDDNGENDRIYKVGTNGIIRVVSNAEVCNQALTDDPNVGDLSLLRVCDPHDLLVGTGDDLYVASPFNGNIFRIDQSGVRSIVAGTTKTGIEGDGTPALSTRLIEPKGLTIAPNGNVLTAEQSGNRVRNIRSILPSYSGQDILIPSSDGDEIYMFDPLGKHLKTLNALTNSVKYDFGYDASGRLQSVTDGYGNITLVTRDGSGNPTGIQSPYNQLTTIELDDNGFLESITDPQGETEQFTYTTGGLMLTKSDALGNQTSFTFDALGRLVRDDDAASGFQTLSRSQTSNSYTVTHSTSLGRVATFKRENLDNSDVRNTYESPDNTQTVETEGADGGVTSVEDNGTQSESVLAPDPRWAMLSPYSALHNVNLSNGVVFNSELSKSVVLSNPFDPLSLVSKSELFRLNGKSYASVFTVNDLTTLDTTPMNRQTTTVIDINHKPTHVQFANLNSLDLSYDTRGRLGSTTSGSGAASRTNTFSYGPNGFLSSSTNPLNQTEEFTYDLAGRVTRQTLADNRQIGFGYLANGLLTTITPPGRPAHTFSYNSRNLVSSYTAPGVGGNSTTNYLYNLDKQITRITRPDALEINYIYGADGKIESVNIPNGSYLFSYNTAGQLAAITPPGTGTLAFEYAGFLPVRQEWTGTVAGSVSVTYNNDLLVASESVNDANPIPFSYDLDNLLTAAGSMTLTRDAENALVTSTSLGNVTDSTEYNGFGETVSYTASFNSTPFYGVDFTYDKLGRITQKTEEIGGVSTNFNYAYDSTGRLSTVSVNNAPPLITYGYDSNGNRTSVDVGGSTTSGTYDAQDRLTTYGSTVYTYSPGGELTGKTSGSATTSYSYDVIGNLRNVTMPDGTQIEYLIDGQNRRIGKKVNGSLIQGFLYRDQLEPIAELDAGGTPVSRFVYASRPNTPDYMIRNGVAYRIICDQVGSVRLVVNVTTGAVAQRIDYDEFGVVLFDSNPNFQPFGFAGGIYDSHTRLSRFGARDYDAETGRWTIKDRLLFGGGDTNFYTYAFGDPVNYFDATGEKGVGGVAGGFLERLVEPFGERSVEYINRKTVEYQNKIADLQKLIDKLEDQKRKCRNKKKKADLQSLIDFLKSRISSYYSEIQNLHNGGSAISTIDGFYKAITTPFGNGK